MKKIHFESIDSTNSWAKRNALSLDRAEVTCVSADCQTAGRGRLHRTWISPAGVNLYVSFCFFIPADKECLFQVGQLLGLSTADLLHKHGFHVRLKWPNDLLIEGKKIGGILCETLAMENQLCVIVGLGLNVNMEREALDLIDQPATSLFIVSEKKYAISQLLEELTHLFNRHLEKFLAAGFESFFSLLDSYQARILALPK